MSEENEVNEVSEVSEEVVLNYKVGDMVQIKTTRWMYYANKYDITDDLMKKLLKIGCFYIEKIDDNYLAYLNGNKEIKLDGMPYFLCGRTDALSEKVYVWIGEDALIPCGTTKTEELKREISRLVQEIVELRELENK